MMSARHGQRQRKETITDLLTFSFLQLVGIFTNTVLALLIHRPGGTPTFSLTKGIDMSPPNLVTQSFLNVLENLPSAHPKIIAISSTGLTRTSYKALPLLLKPFYSYILPLVHKDKCGIEEVIAHCVGRSLDARYSVGDEILGANWENRLPSGRGQLQNIVVVRPALLTDGECRGDVKGSGAYRVNEGDVESSWTVSRRDVAHFLVEGVVNHWQDWKGKCVSIAY